jgi:hypothetical protein
MNTPVITPNPSLAHVAVVGASHNFTTCPECEASRVADQADHEARIVRKLWFELVAATARAAIRAGMSVGEYCKSTS